MIKAIAEVSEGKKTIYKAAKEYNVPKETLRRHVILGIGTGAQKQGAKPVLSFEEEQPLVDALQYCSKCHKIGMILQT